MKILISILIGLLVVGCGKKVGVKDIDNEMMKQAMQWDADIKLLKLEVEHLKADVKRLEKEAGLEGTMTNKKGRGEGFGEAHAVEVAVSRWKSTDRCEGTGEAHAVNEAGPRR